MTDIFHTSASPKTLPLPCHLSPHAIFEDILQKINVSESPCKPI
jgi:hypothetical protein